MNVDAARHHCATMCVNVNTMINGMTQSESTKCELCLFAFTLLADIAIPPPHVQYISEEGGGVAAGTCGVNK